MTSVTTTSTSRPSSSSGRPPGLAVEVEVTDSAFGDLGPRLEERGDVAWARQVHGATALAVDAPGCAGEADALVTATPGLRLAVRAADCGPLVLASTAGRPCVGVVHVGWRGARDGVVEAAAAALRSLSGSDAVTGWLGPCIRSCCYEFGDDERDQVAAVLGDSVRGTTSWGAPSLDLPAAVAAAAHRAGVELTGSDGRCTACALDGSGRPLLFSHRARSDRARHGVLACLR
jgi:copper oxidase (laccase) domain-containing protein